MRTYPIIAAVVLTTVSCTAGALAENTESAASAAATPAAVAPATTIPAPNQTIYLPRLPAPAELMSAAAAQGLTVERIDQTSTQITVVYKYSNGQVNVVCYQLLASATSQTAPVATTAAPATTTTTTIVYTEPARRVYYTYDPYYDPWYWVAPVCVGLSFDYAFHGGHWGGHGGGGFHGGPHGR